MMEAASESVKTAANSLVKQGAGMPCLQSQKPALFCKDVCWIAGMGSLPLQEGGQGAGGV